MWLALRAEPAKAKGHPGKIKGSCIDANCLALSSNEGERIPPQRGKKGAHTYTIQVDIRRECCECNAIQRNVVPYSTM